MADSIDLIDTTNLMLSGCLIFVAMVFDALDGYVARLARTTSDFGAQLDSLCDVVSFGVGAGLPAVKMCLGSRWFTINRMDHCGGIRGVRGVAIGPIQRGDERRGRSFVLQRLAESGGRGSDCRVRHRVLHVAPRHDYAEGIESVDRRGLAVGFAVFWTAGGLLMVSRIRYPHITNRVLRGQRSFGHVVAVVFFFVAIMLVRGYAVRSRLAFSCCTAGLPCLETVGATERAGRTVV